MTKTLRMGMSGGGIGNRDGRAGCSRGVVLEQLICSTFGRREGEETIPRDTKRISELADLVHRLDLFQQTTVSPSHKRWIAMILRFARGKKPKEKWAGTSLMDATLRCASEDISRVCRARFAVAAINLLRSCELDT